MTTTTATKPQFDLVDAATVQIDPNIRTDVVLDAEFVASIAEHGVLVPVLARRDADGTLYVRAGQRRTLAAKQLQQELPVIWFNGADSAPEPAWLATALQLVENDHRAPLTTGQRVAAYEQLALEGLSVTKIAQAVSKPKDQVKAALTISKSEKAKALASQYDIDLLQLAAMVEFEADEDTTEQLLETALDDPDQFDHAVSAARQEKARRALIQGRRDELEAAGKTTIDRETTYGQAERLTSLERDETITVDPELGDGFGIYVALNGLGELVETEYILDPATFGYKHRYASSSAPSGPMTEAQKAERRRVIACNKAWDAAEPVRVEWVTSFLGRKAIPKDAASVIAVAFTRYGYELTSHGDHLAHKLLGIEETHGGRHINALASAVDANPAKAGLVMIALTLGKLESGTSRNTWRNPEPVSKFYLLQLREWGYNLSPVELIAIGEATDLPDSGNSLDDTDIEDFEDDDAAEEAVAD